jgi:ADP-ribose pyrophosphatase
VERLSEKLVRREVVFRGRYVQTEIRTVRLPGGQEVTREVVAPPNAVAVLPLDEAGNVHLVRQYRTAIEQAILEIPAGILEAGETPEQTGRRECEEESGVIPHKMERLVGFYHSVGFSTGRIEIYLATGLTPSSRVHNEVLAGEIVDSKTLVAVLWYRQRRERPR